jgi:hypothetical protein
MIAVQWGAGAFRNNRSSDSDEHAHLVTGLMVRDYLASGWNRGPIEFARDYYLRYPKVAIGHWPPVFYFEQAAWTLFLPTSRQSLLVMMALQVAVLAMVVWSMLLERFGPAAAWCGALALCTLPGVVSSSTSVMTELAVAIPISFAILAWGRFLDTGRAWSAAAFGLWSAAAVLTKGTGIVLAGVPLLSACLAGRTQLFRRAWFWLPAFIVAALCAPWYLLAPGAMHDRVVRYGGPALVTRRLEFPAVTWADQFGWPVSALALVGLVALLCRRATGFRLDGVLASGVAAVICSSLCPLLFKVWGTRHLTEAAPMFLLVAASGAGWIASRRPVGRLAAHRILALLALATLLFALAWNLSRIRRKQPFGYRQLAAAVLAGGVGPAKTILVVGDPGAEGSVISEIAQREPHPARFLLRASKLFVDVSWQGRLRRTRAGSSAEVQALLHSLPVDLIVIDRIHPSPFAYQTQLERVLAEHPETWRKVDLPLNSPGLAAFRRADPPLLSDQEREAALKTALPEPIL